MVGTDLPSKLLTTLSKAADVLRGHKFVHIYSHYDADGITAASIAAKAVHRLGMEYQVTIFTTLIDETMKIIEETPAECVLVTDLGASYIRRFDAMKCDVIVLDHHTLGDAAERICYANPHLYGIDGMTSGCGATMAFLFAITLDQRNWDLAPIAMAGIAGDRQHLNGMTGLNAYLLEGAEKRGLIETQPGSVIPVGRLSDELYLSTDPFVIGVTGNRDGVKRLLADAGIPEDRDYADLTDDERERLSSLITVKLITQGVSREKLGELVRTKYYLPTWKRDAEWLSSVLNSAGRAGIQSVGIAAAMGDAKCMEEAVKTDAESREGLMKAVLETVEQKKLTQMENIQWFDSTSTGFTGMICGVLMSYVGDPSKPTIGVNTSDPRANVSSRGTFSQLDAGVDLADAMKRGCASVGGEGGGHRIAAGGSFDSPRRDEFLKNVDALIGEQKAARAEGR